MIYCLLNEISSDSIWHHRIRVNIGSGYAWRHQDITRTNGDLLSVMSCHILWVVLGADQTTKPLSEPIMEIELMHICVTRPQWFRVNMLPVDRTGRSAGLIRSIFAVTEVIVHLPERQLFLNKQRNRQLLTHCGPVTHMASGILVNTF